VQAEQPSQFIKEKKKIGRPKKKDKVAESCAKMTEFFPANR
jgi:hypothetical protein